jgi:hypothetical protein
MIERSYFHKYIYTNKHSIHPDLCKQWIELFDNEEIATYEGVTAGGLNKETKDTTDLLLPKNKETKWKNSFSFLEKELARNLQVYTKELNDSIKNIHVETSSKKFQLFPSNNLTTNNFMIQRYRQNKGRYIFHDDFSVEWTERKYRVITFLWYLNTVEEGGETQIWDDTFVKPEAGKLLLFPSTWTFPHRGKIPLSSDKYIITGWLYSEA